MNVKMVKEPWQAAAAAAHEVTAGNRASTLVAAVVVSYSQAATPTAMWAVPVDIYAVETVATTTMMAATPNVPAVVVVEPVGSLLI